MATRLTRNASNNSYIDGGADKNNNLQALCEAAGGLVSGEGAATWANLKTLTITDTRVTPTSIIDLGAVYGSQDQQGFWRVSSRSAGSFVVTSTEFETAGTTFWYSVLNA